MKLYPALALLALIGACGRGESSRAPADSLTLTLDAYSSHRIIADSAPRVFVARRQTAGAPSWTASRRIAGRMSRASQLGFSQVDLDLPCSTTRFDSPALEGSRESQTCGYPSVRYGNRELPEPQGVV